MIKIELKKKTKINGTVQLLQANRVPLLVFTKFYNDIHELADEPLCGTYNKMIDPRVRVRGRISKTAPFASQCRFARFLSLPTCLLTFLFPPNKNKNQKQKPFVLNLTLIGFSFLSF